MRRPKSYEGIDLAAMADDLASVDGFAAMPSIRKRRLALLLIESRAIYDIRQARDANPVPAATAREIEKILASIHRIAEFAKRAKESPVAQDAMLRIIYAEEALSSDGESGNLVSGFFDRAAETYRIASTAQRAMASFERERAQLSPIVWLAGYRLPHLYSKIFGARFTTTRGDNAGIAFVQSSLKAIRVRSDEMSDETIITHFKAATKALAEAAAA